MNTQHKIFGITPTEPLQILRLSIEQQLGTNKTVMSMNSIKAIQLQATSSISKTTSGTEVATRIDFLTLNGIFHNDELSGIGIPQTEDEHWIIQLNFISEVNTGKCSLIVPTKKYPAGQMQNNYFLQKIIDRFTEDRYPLQLKKDQIIAILVEVFSEMTGKDILLDKEGGN
ncbi:hypothetical protein [Polynucleobacter sp. UB-Siik-W21]|uniref:hypothetical protein n=1 Tax=Polynucleobacter sp. UB-Siik-W21 TaxID=1855646 RepID=UPI001BFECE6B|nr:hypothetical protein [Polynucleobacter sp. UB-Siik-W21]QWD69656.1 hypothetical protein C2756_06940 [Polynucleobacter sp. UB-Siik-W21]